MGAGDDGKREDDRPTRAVDAPVHGHQGRSGDDHACDDGGTNYERQPEATENLGHFEEEVGALHFLLRRSPADVVREQVGEKGLREMDGQSTEEEEEEWNPSNVLDEGIE